MPGDALHGLVQALTLSAGRRKNGFVRRLTQRQYRAATALKTCCTLAMTNHSKGKPEQDTPAQRTAAVDRLSDTHQTKRGTRISISPLLKLMPLCSSVVRVACRKGINVHKPGAQGVVVLTPMMFDNYGEHSQSFQ